MLNICAPRPAVVSLPGIQSKVDRIHVPIERLQDTIRASNLSPGWDDSAMRAGDLTQPRLTAAPDDQNTYEEIEIASSGQNRASPSCVIRSGASIGLGT